MSDEGQDDEIIIISWVLTYILEILVFAGKPVVVCVYKKYSHDVKCRINFLGIGNYKIDSTMHHQSLL